MPRTPLIDEARRSTLPTVGGVMAEIRAMAEEAFAKHVLVREGEGRWICRSVGAAYWFRVITAPSTVIIIGDVGEAILSISSPDPLPWLRGRARAGAFDAEYVIQKIHGASKTFYAGSAVAVVEDLMEDADGEFVRRLRDLVSDLDELDDEKSWWNAWEMRGLESEDLCTAYGPSEASIWTSECIRWFARALVAAEESDPIDLTAHATEEKVQ